MKTFYIYKDEEFIEPISAETEEEFVKFFNNEFSKDYYWLTEIEDDPSE